MTNRNPEKQRRDAPQDHHPENSLIQDARDCQARLKDADKGYHQQLYKELEEVYRLAEGFHGNQNAWVKFTKEKFWDQCKSKKPKATEDYAAIIYWVTRFAFRAALTTGPRYNRAYKHARTLQGYARDGVAADEVAATLAEEGADYAFVFEVENYPRQAETDGEGNEAEPSRNSGQDGEGEGGGAFKGNGSNDDPKRPASSKRAQPSRTTAEKLSSRERPESKGKANGSSDGPPILELKLTPSNLDKVLNMKAGEYAKVTFDRIPSRITAVGIWQRFKVTSLVLNEE